MFDLRHAIKIFVGNGEVRYGTRVDQGFFPVYSVQFEEDAKTLVEQLPWGNGDTLTAYARRLESMCDAVISARENGLQEEFQNKLNAEREMMDIRNQLMEIGKNLNTPEFVLSKSEDDLAALRQQFQEGVDRLEVLVEENQKPNPIAMAIMEASE